MLEDAIIRRLFESRKRLKEVTQFLELDTIDCMPAEPDRYTESSEGYLDLLRSICDLLNCEMSELSFFYDDVPGAQEYLEDIRRTSPPVSKYEAILDYNAEVHRNGGAFLFIMEDSSVNMVIFKTSDADKLGIKLV